MTTIFMAAVPQIAFLKSQPTTAYSFGTGDFTLVAMPRTHSTGALISYRSSTADGFVLGIDTEGAAHFTVWIDGIETLISTANGVVPVDGTCHCISVVRQSGDLSIFVDCIPSLLKSGGTSATLAGSVSVEAAAPLELASGDHGSSFSGGLMNVGIWTKALTGDGLRQAGFAVLELLADQMAGYWTLNNTTADLSPLQNTLQIVRNVSFMQCFDCVWLHGDNHFQFLQMQSTPHAPADGHVSEVETVTSILTDARSIHVPSGAPALVVSMLGAPDGSLAPPNSGLLTLIDPNGTVYDTHQNTDTVFVSLTNDIPTAITITTPMEGEWRIILSCNANQAVYVQAQVIASANGVATMIDALTPIFDPTGSGATTIEDIALGGFWSVIGKIAVAAVSGVVVAAVIVASGGLAVPAAVVGLAAFCAVSVFEAAASLETMGQGHIDTITQVGGLSGFFIVNANILLIDANVSGDRATQTIYHNRQRFLYPAVNASGFKTKQTHLIGVNDNRTKVKTALTNLGNGYVSAGGHGHPHYLTGWHVSGNSGALEQVLTVGRYDAVEVRGKIIHFFACSCGHARGLGPDLVRNGAVAFFGYRKPFQLMPDYGKWFCLPDIEIDLALILGKTCLNAFEMSIKTYNKHIEKLKHSGRFVAAAALESNRDAIVAPSTRSALYGNPKASLYVGV